MTSLRLLHVGFVVIPTGQGSFFLLQVVGPYHEIVWVGRAKFDAARGKIQRQGHKGPDQLTVLCHGPQHWNQLGFGELLKVGSGGAGKESPLMYVHTPGRLYTMYVSKRAARLEEKCRQTKKETWTHMQISSIPDGKSASGAGLAYGTSSAVRQLPR